MPRRGSRRSSARARAGRRWSRPRCRAEATSPADVGLPTGSRRRTPGLRRAELATLAGISVDYLIRLEQGRDRRPSAQVLAALADALRLGDDDRELLRRFAAHNAGAELCPSAAAPARSVRPTVRALLAGLEPAAAFVLNRLSDLLAWTDGYARIAGPLGVLDGPDGEAPNLVRYTFADPRARIAYPDWDAIADEQVANLRAAVRPDVPRDHDLVTHLAAAGGADFTDRWAARPVVRKRTGTKRVAHPEVGELRLAFETLQLADADDQRLVVYLPGDEATAAALDRLAGRHPGALRAVVDSSR
ncbi:MAG TPA: helix-turn-helix domain-containing protein [Acidimicrobiales bacterium]|nr:helix-turn-helix domain-containing protein [Acidimicrobiales bacterium]